jgi:SAM-dependent methyltransferase
MNGETDAQVQAQYEQFPYPDRNPADEAKRLIAGSPSHLDEIRHYLHGGQLDLSRPFRALIAGGGTGDAAIMLAQQLADANAADAQVTYLDLSTASRAIAEARAEVRGLANIRFVTGKIEQIGNLAPGPYDHIDCCGVLHHLASPETGLQALKAHLAPGGGMGLMVYGTLGRTGVYPIQEALAQLADALPDRERLATARKLLEGLPASHWLKRNPYVGDHLKGDAAGLYDLLLHRRDRAYRVEELADLVASAEMKIAAWIEPARYAPETYLSDPALRQTAATLSPIGRSALAERLSGAMAKHVVYAIPSKRILPEIDPGADGSVLVFRDMDPEATARGLRPSGTLTADISGAAYSAPLPALAPRLAALIDGHRSIAEIRETLRETGAPMPSEANFRDQVRKLFAAFNGINRMLVRSTSDV